MSATTDLTHAPLSCVLILGLGATGVAAARWYARRGVRLRIADMHAQPLGLAELQAVFNVMDPAVVQPDYCLGCPVFDPTLLDGVEQVVLSPGLSPDQAPANELLACATARGIEIVSEIEVFARVLADLAQTRDYRPHLLAVTGTNGKTTVTALTRLLVANCGLTALAAGNIGPAALHALMAALDSDTLPQVWVLEVSSFQLASTQTLVPDAAVVLNVTPDHLDWHGSMPAYVQAKARLLPNAHLAIVNRDDAVTRDMVPALDARQVGSFGRDVPTWAGDLGLVQEQGVMWLVACETTEFEISAPSSSRQKKNGGLTARARGQLNRLMPANALRLRGLHNATNVLAAFALGRALGLGWGPMLRAAREYAGEPHRVALICHRDGVDFIDDSKATNVGATVTALEGLGQTIVLIVGGLGKGQDFSPLRSAVARHARAVVYMGQDGAEIASELVSTGVPCVPAQDLRVAVQQALTWAQSGDAVLLSPACASMDMFRNYIHRGQVFAQEVQALALEQGGVV